MSRSGYSNDGENIAMWRGQVASAIRGKRGQAFLRELVEALDAMPEKRLTGTILFRRMDRSARLVASALGAALICQSLIVSAHKTVIHFAPVKCAAFNDVAIRS